MKYEHDGNTSSHEYMMKKDCDENSVTPIFISVSTSPVTRSTTFSFVLLESTKPFAYNPLIATLYLVYQLSSISGKRSRVRCWY